MRSLFEARLVNDAFGDPALYVDFRDERRALLFDLGDISVLPPRKLMRLSHVFVTVVRNNSCRGHRDVRNLQRRSRSGMMSAWCSWREHSSG
jgi:hypothetical protein